jgi:hypothetical protein
MKHDIVAIGAPAGGVDAMKPVLGGLTAELPTSMRIRPANRALHPPFSLGLDLRPDYLNKL